MPNMKQRYIGLTKIFFGGGMGPPNRSSAYWNSSDEYIVDLDSIVVPDRGRVWVCRLPTGVCLQHRRHLDLTASRVALHVINDEGEGSSCEYQFWRRLDSKYRVALLVQLQPYAPGQVSTHCIKHAESILFMIQSFDKEFNCERGFDYSVDDFATEGTGNP